MKTRKTVFAMGRPCPRCGESDPSSFHAGGQSYCKRCQKDAVYRHRLAKQGITPEDLARQSNEQDNKCFTCGAHEKLFRRSLHSDHNPRTGAARKLLCGRCNQVIGRVKDDASLLRTLADYIDSHNQ